MSADLSSPLAPISANGSAASEAAVANSINAFGLDLYAQLQSEVGGNLFVSPFSVSTALTMALAGAGGETAAQMAQVLHVSLSPDEQQSAIGSLLADLNGAGQADGFTLDLANALWAQQGYALAPAFMNLLQADYGAGLKQVDFIDDPEAARQTINDWVQTQTQGKIADLFPQGTITPQTRIALTNAIYFNGSWATAFDAKQTNDANFTLASGSQATVPTMHGTGWYRYMESDGFLVLELPYAGGRLSMDVVLPSDNNGVSAIDVQRLPANLSAWLQGLGDQDVAVSLPKFEMTTQFDLIAPLKALGMTDAFTYGADFSGITGGPNNLHISHAVHKAFIDVNETGTEAAAATGIGITPTIAVESRIDFDANHPFLFLIRDNQSGGVLFMGQVMNPLQSGSDRSTPVIVHDPKAVAPVANNPTGTNDPAGGGSTPPSVSPTVAAPLTPNQSYVTAVFRDVLGRAVEAAGLSYWSHLLDQGFSRSTFAEDVTHSDEFFGKLVDADYHRYLGRDADVAGLQFWIERFRAGLADEQLEAELIASPEFYDRAGGADRAWVDAMYFDLLGRSADAAGESFWVQSLANGVSRASAAYAMATSSERETERIEAEYQQLLGRVPSGPEVAAWVSAFQSGMSDESIVSVLVASVEYYDNTLNRERSA